MKRVTVISILLLLVVGCASNNNSLRTVTVCKNNYSFSNYSSFTHTIIAQGDEIQKMDAVGILNFDSMEDRDSAFKMYKESESEFNENNGIRVSNEIYEDTSIVQNYEYDLELVRDENLITGSINPNKNINRGTYLSRDMMIKQIESTDFTCNTE